MNHPNIVGFRAAQRLSDGHLCLALEHCEASLYSFIQERVKPHGGCVSPTREARAGDVFSPSEVMRIGKVYTARALTRARKEEEKYWERLRGERTQRAGHFSIHA